MLSKYLTASEADRTYLNIADYDPEGGGGGGGGGDVSRITESEIDKIIGN